MKFRIVTLSLVYIITLFLNNAKSADIYWVDGSGTWSTLSHWATTSGGSTSPGTVPQSMDNIFFDENSGFTPGNNVVTIDETIISCKDMNWTGATNSPVLAGSSDNMLFIYGSLVLIPDMAFSFAGSIDFLSFTPGNIITSAGHPFSQNIVFDGSGGEWAFQDAFSTSRDVYHYDGAIFSNNNDITVRYWIGYSGDASLM